MIHPPTLSPQSQARRQVRQERKLQRQVRTSTLTETYGFVLYIVTLVAVPVWLLWILLPHQWLQSLMMEYTVGSQTLQGNSTRTASASNFTDEWLSTHYWSLAVPTFLSVTLVAVPILYGFYNMQQTLPLSHINTVTDPFAIAAPPAVNFEHARQSRSIPPIGDMPAAQVNQMLYRYK